MREQVLAKGGAGQHGKVLEQRGDVQIDHGANSIIAKGIEADCSSLGLSPILFSLFGFCWAHSISSKVL